MEQTSKAYNFRIVNLEGSFRSALTSLLTQYPIKAIFMGQRRDDPGATPQEVAKSDPGWPEFYRYHQHSSCYAHFSASHSIPLMYVCVSN